MGQAVRKLESYYRNSEIKHRKQPRIHLNYIENNHVYNNNNDYDLYVLINKSNAIKEYLNRNIEKKVESMKNQEKLLTIPEAAEYCGLRSDKTIRNWIKQGMPFVEVPGKTYPKKLVSISNLENWRNGKVETKTESMNFSNLENHEPMNNSEPEILVPTSMSLPNNNFVTQDQLNAYTTAINNFATTLADIKQEGRHELDKQREYFESMLAQQQELTVSMFEELKREKDNENKEVLTAIENVKKDSYSNTENILKEYEWIKKQNEDILAAQNKRPWWQFWKK